MSNHVIGVDEVGWGCIAGPIVVCAAHVPFGEWDKLREQGFRDSKKVGNKRTRYTTGKCEQLATWLDESAEGKLVRASWAIVQADPDQIDREKSPGETKMTLFRRAVLLLMSQNNWLDDQVEVIVDGAERITTLPRTIAQEAVPKADDHVMPVAVASILAKAKRDRQMWDLHDQFPLYNLGSNVGYPTPPHIETVIKHGPIKGIHRMHYLKATVQNHFAKNPRDTVPHWVRETGWLKT